MPWAATDTTPSLYPRRECKELPGWLAYDKQVNVNILDKSKLTRRIKYS